jgi:hypothetical protein
MARPTAITCNFFAPLRALEVDTDTTAGDGADSGPLTQQPELKGVGRPPPTILTTAVSLLRFQGEKKTFMNGTFEFRTIRSGMKVVTSEMPGYSAIMRHLNDHNVLFYTSHPKSMKPMKAVIRQLPGDTPAEDKSNELMTMGFSVISVRQMKVTRPQPKGSHHTFSIPLFLVTLIRNGKALEIFKISIFGHVVIKAEAYRVQAGLMQCYKCQKFSCFWANCRQPPPPRAICGAEATTSIKCSLRRTSSTQPPGAATLHWQKGEKKTSLELSRLQPRKRLASPQKGTESPHGEESTWESLLFHVHNPSHFLRRSIPWLCDRRQQQPQQLEGMSEQAAV